MWIVLIRDHTSRSVQSDLNLHCPQKVPVSSSVREELKDRNFGGMQFF